VRLEGLGQPKNAIISLEMEPTTFWLVSGTVLPYVKEVPKKAMASRMKYSQTLGEDLKLTLS
jgi:hypothetical protein